MQVAILCITLAVAANFLKCARLLRAVALLLKKCIMGFGGLIMKRGVFKLRRVAVFVLALCFLLLAVGVTACNGDDSNTDGTIAICNDSQAKIITDIWVGRRYSEFDTSESFEHKVSSANIRPGSSYYLSLENGYYAIKVYYRDLLGDLPYGATDYCTTLIKRLDEGEILGVSFNGTAIGWE